MAITLFVSIGSPEHIRGYLDRYCVEVSEGIWLGTLRKPVRDEIWSLLKEKEAKALMIYPDSTTVIGYKLFTNDAYTRIIDLDGLPLVGKWLKSEEETT